MRWGVKMGMTLKIELVQKPILESSKIQTTKNEITKLTKTERLLSNLTLLLSYNHYCMNKLLLPFPKNHLSKDKFFFPTQKKILD